MLEVIAQIGARERLEQTILHNAIQMIPVQDQTGSPVDRAGNRDFYPVVVAMKATARAKDLQILFRTKTFSRQCVQCREGI